MHIINAIPGCMHDHAIICHECVYGLIRDCCFDSFEEFLISSVSVITQATGCPVMINSFLLHFWQIYTCFL